MLNRLSGQYRIRILVIVAMAATGFFCPYSQAMAADAVHYATTRGYPEIAKMLTDVGGRE